MKKWIISIGLTVASFLSGDSISLDSFSYHYEIISASNEAKDLLQLYRVKEHLIQTYYQLIYDLETEKIPEVLAKNIKLLALDDKVTIDYQEGVLILTIDQGRGISIRGSFPKSYCDPNELNVRFYFLEWFYQD